MKNVHITLGIPEYHEWRWLLSPYRQEKYGLLLKKEIKKTMVEELAWPIIIVKPVISGGGKKRSLSPTRESSVKKKPKTSFAVCEGLLLGSS